jgi:tetratricopeptide (TPR) repeat protein
MISLHRRRVQAFCCLCLSFLCTRSTAQQLGGLGDHLRASVPSSPSPSPKISTELRGDIFMARKMYRDAIDMYRQGSADSPILANKIGIAFHQMMLLDIAKKNYERAIKLDPKFSEAINNLGTIYYAQKNYRHSIGLYKRSLKYAESPTASVYANIGAAYFARKDYKHASEWYNQALKLDPEVFEHHSSYGTLMQERTTTEMAVFHLYLAKTYAKNGDNVRAVNYLRKAMEEGVKDREKIPTMPEFASLKSDPAFMQLLSDNPRPL